MSSQPTDPPMAADTPALSSVTRAAQPPEAAPVGSMTNEVTASDVVQTGGEKSGDAVPNMGDTTDATTKKKKKSKKSKGKSLEKREYYCDPPLTANEHWEEQNNIYTTDRPCHDRFQEGIQRFGGRRRMNNDQRNYFSKFLMLGGIDTTQRQFQGTSNMPKGKKDDPGEDADEEDIVLDAAEQLSKEEKNRLEKDDVIRAEANDVISLDPNVTRFYSPGAEGWVEGDFEAVAAGFLSSKFMNDLSAREGAVDTAIATVISFLKYLLQHDVCPEYEANVKKAWEVCERAKIELPMCAAVIREAPGEFNTAARILFCTDQQPHDCTVDPAHPMDAYREKDPKYWEFQDAILVPKSFKAKFIFKSTMAFSITHFIVPWDYEAKGYAIKDTYNQDYEVVDPKDHQNVSANPEFPGEGDEFIHSALDKDHNLKPVGKIFVKPCVIEDGWDNRLSRADASDKVEFFLLEVHILHLLTIGMKLRLVVCELDCGFKFVKQVLDVLPSFYTFLPQELMLQYKEPKLNERPAPSVDDPDVEDRALENAACTDARE